MSVQSAYIDGLIYGRRLNQLSLATSISSTLPKVHENLPPQHGEFLGREKEKERILKGLRSRGPVVSIEGLGGMGKTTLAIETARSCLSEPQAVLDPPFEQGLRVSKKAAPLICKMFSVIAHWSKSVIALLMRPIKRYPDSLFEYVVWVSAKDQPEKFWLNEVLDTTAHILGYPSIMNLPSEQIEQKKAAVTQLLHSYRTLLIIDNFETIKDCALESWMQDVPDPSKVLVTIRTDQLPSARSITLKGLDDSAALELIRSSAQSLELESLETASEETLLPLVQVTGGNPQAIGMALGYIKCGMLSLHEVIKHLEVASPTVDGVFAYLFDRVWHVVMTEDAQQVLLVVPFFADYASKEALGATAGLSESHLNKAVKELVQLKMLDIQDASVVSRQCYTIHPLTRAFVSAELRKRQEFEKEARMRWSEYYRGLADRSLTLGKPKDRYWNGLPPHKDRELIDLEWPNLQEVLAWADQQKQDKILVELMVLLPPYMYGSMRFPARIDYSLRAADAASRLGQKGDAALLHIDARGWILLEVGRLEEAISAITTGLHIAQTLDPSSPEAIDLVALAHAWLARASLEQGNLVEASALMKKIMSLECKPVIRYRVLFVAGDIQHKRGNFLKAIELYNTTEQINIPYRGELVDARLGDAYLASRNLAQAEVYFNKVLKRQKEFGNHETPYAKFGLARIAQAKGERDKARELAQEVLGDLRRTGTSHKLLNEIYSFLKD
jgi:LuxR family transcriptional regulator, glucitol operon activator